jgi:hypothetical protein
MNLNTNQFHIKSKFSMQIQIQSKPSSHEHHKLKQKSNFSKKTTIIQTNQNKLSITSRRSFGLKDFYKQW